MVKRGAGTMILAPESLTYDGSNRCFDYRERFIVEGGDLIFPQDVASSGKGYFHGSLAVSNGCTVAPSLTAVRWLWRAVTNLPGIIRYTSKAASAVPAISYAPTARRNAVSTPAVARSRSAES